jgi:protein-S-isoprenylcysteine O-methyltransferase Ste14
MPKRFKYWILGVTAVTAGLFTLAGTWRDPWLWAYMIVWSTTTFYAMAGIDDDLARERFRPPVKSADNVALTLVRVFGLTLVVVGALDSGRWHLMPVPPALRAVALAGMAIGFTMFFRAMHENRFFSAVVRVQRDRGHRVVDSGPYAVVRHPGYAGILVAMPFVGLALGSMISFALGLLLSLMVIRRVLFEDRFLRSNLEGYSAYAARVRHRLVPGVW